MAWLSKLVNIAMWPAKATTRTFLYYSRVLLDGVYSAGVLVVARGFVAIVPQGVDNSSAQNPDLSQQTTQEALVSSPAEIGSSAVSDSTASQQLGTWTWVPAPVYRVTNFIIVKPIRFVWGPVREKGDHVYVWITAHLPPLPSLRDVAVGLYAYGVIGAILLINIIVMNFRRSSIVKRLTTSSPKPEEPGSQSPPPTGRMASISSIVKRFITSSPKPEEQSPPPTVYVEAFIEEFVKEHSPGYKCQPLSELGSRMKKDWVELIPETGAPEHEEQHQHLLLTYAPVSQNCPLLLHEHQRGLNKFLNAIKEHPYIHPIKEVYYSAAYEKLIMVQPFRTNGSLKDIIYKVSHPTLNWSEKYAHRSKGLSPETVARYGRHILEGMMFLRELGLPPIDHVQSGNAFVVDEVCKLGGYENTLLGYKTRIYRLCKDHLPHLDVILFGHLIFEMCAGYELTEVRPRDEDYRAAPSSVRPILEFIFAEGFPHTIKDIAEHDFFRDDSYLPPELKKFDSSTIHTQLSDSAKTVLEKVRKNKPRVQKPPSTEVGFKAMFSRIHIHLPTLPRFFRTKKDHKSADQVSISSKQSN